MSKTQLKKLLSELTHQQISELVLDLYQARPQAKEYLDFYVQPDIDKRMDRARANIKKEFMRQSRGRNKGRITRVKQFIKDISSLNPGADYEIELKLFAIEKACEAGSEQFVKETTQRAVARLINETLLQADRHSLLQQASDRIYNAIKALPSSIFSRNSYRNLLLEAYHDALSETATHIN